MCLRRKRTKENQDWEAQMKKKDEFYGTKQEKLQKRCFQKSTFTKTVYDEGAKEELEN